MIDLFPLRYSRKYAVYQENKQPRNSERIIKFVTFCVNFMRILERRLYSVLFVINSQNMLL